MGPQPSSLTVTGVVLILLALCLVPVLGLWAFPVLGLGAGLVR